MTRLIERFCRSVEVVAGVLLGLCTILIVASAIGRYVFAAPIPDAFDATRLLVGACVMWGFASVGFRGGHISVDLLWEVLPERGRRAMDVFAWGTLLVFAILLAIMGWGRVASAFASNESTFDLRLPVWPLLGMIWLGSVASVATIAYRMWQLRKHSAPHQIEGGIE